MRTPVIISVVGSHAGESLSEVFIRKQQEIKNAGHTFWLYKSLKASSLLVQDCGRVASTESQPLTCLFVEASQRGGARPTTHTEAAREYSIDGQTWIKIPKGIITTGKLDQKTTAFVISDLEVLKEPEIIDLWEYSELKTEKPLKMMLGSSTLCCYKKPSVGMKSRFRKVIAKAILCDPYAVYLRSN